MKEHVTQQLEMLKNFLNNVKAIEQNPYSKGIDATKLIEDVIGFADDLEKSLGNIPEEETQPDKEENAEIEEITE